MFSTLGKQRWSWAAIAWIVGLFGFLLLYDLLVPVFPSATDVAAVVGPLLAYSFMGIGSWTFCYCLATGLHVARTANRQGERAFRPRGR